MNDWNGNRRYDPADSYMDYKLSGAGGSSGKTPGGSGGCGWGIVAVICFLIVLLAVCCR